MALSPALQTATPRWRYRNLAHMGVGVGIFLLFAGQLAIGTSLPFASLVALYAVLTWTTVTIVNGPFTVSGFLITATAFVHVLLGQIVKTILREPPDQALLAPNATLFVACLSMVGFLFAAITLKSVKIDKWKTLLPEDLDIDRLRTLAIFLLIASSTTALIQFALSRPGVAQVGGFFTITRTLTRAYPLAVCLITAVSIKKKKRLLTYPVVYCIAFGLFLATVNASRNEFLESILMVILTCIFYLHKPKIGEVAILAFFLFFYQHYYTPYALDQRGTLRALPIHIRIPEAFRRLGTYVLEREKLVNRSDDADARLPYDRRRTYYYTTIGKNATLDRFTILPVMDSVIAQTIAKDPEGPATTIWGFKLVVPNVLYPEKPIQSTGNVLAQKGRGLVNPEDHVTQIAMGFTPDALVSYGLSGVVGTYFFIGVIFLAVHRWMYGLTLINNSLGLGVILSAALTFSQGTIASQIQRILLEAPGIGFFMLMLIWMVNSLTRRRTIGRMQSNVPTPPMVTPNRTGLVSE